MITTRCVLRTAVALAAALAFTPLPSPAEKLSQEPSRRTGSKQQTVYTQSLPKPRAGMVRAGHTHRGRRQDLQDLLQKEADAQAKLTRELTGALAAQTRLTKLMEASTIHLRKSLALQKHIARQATTTSEELRQALQSREEDIEKARETNRTLKESLALERQKMEIERAAFESSRQKLEHRIASLQTEAAKPKRAPLAIKVEPLHFGMNQTAAAEEENRLLTQIRTILSIRPDATMRVTGHTCNIGDPGGNLALSEHRARHVADFLIHKGVPAAKITEVRGLGPDHPLADNSTLSGRRLNRRVEVELLSP